MDGVPNSARRSRSRRDYDRSKSRSDHVLLRLDPGGAAALDEAARAAGLSRAAFCRLFLAPLAAALAPRLPAIEASRIASGRSLGQFLAAALDASLADGGQPEPDPGAAAAEFDALFG